MKLVTLAVVCIVLMVIYWNMGSGAVLAQHIPKPTNQARISAILGTGLGSDGLEVLYQSVKLTRSDMELIRQDNLRARAAYPDTPDLFEGRWFAFDTSQKIKDSEFNIPNSHYTNSALESGYISVVSAVYKNRATPGETEKYYQAQAEFDRAHPAFKANKQWDRQSPGHQFGVPYISDEFLLWASDKGFRPIVIGSGSSGIILSIYRPAAHGFVWNDGSKSDTEQIRIEAKMSEIRQAEIALKELGEAAKFENFLGEENGFLSEAIYQLKSDGTMARIVQRKKMGL